MEWRLPAQKYKKHYDSDQVAEAVKQAIAFCYPRPPRLPHMHPCQYTVRSSVNRRRYDVVQSVLCLSSPSTVCEVLIWLFVFVISFVRSFVCNRFFCRA